MNKIKSFLTVSVFCVIVFGFALSHLALADLEISRTERRKMAQAPVFSLSTALSGEYADSLEEYLSDQFPLREDFRELKAALHFGIFRQSDSNGFYLYEGSIIKTESILKEDQVSYAAELFQTIYENNLSGMNVYFSIVPDKAYFTQSTSRPSLDYERLVSIMQSGFASAQYIDIFDLISLDAYYNTDSHWRQNKIFPVVEHLAVSMGAGDTLTPEAQYTENRLSPFYGVYLGQAAISVPADEIVYLTSALTESAVLTGYEFEGEKNLYTLDKFNGLDGYDIFLNGAQALLEIYCEEAKTDRELIVFRDSFGSSLSPLLVGAYAKITIVDLRYCSSVLLPQLIDFENQDVLFIHSTTMLNGAMVMK